MEARSLGTPVPNWTPPPRPLPGPAGTVLTGRFVRLEPLDPARHAVALHEGFAGRPDLFDYLPILPPEDAAAFRAWAEEAAGAADPVFYALCDPATGRAQGLAAWLHIAPEAGSIEVGGLVFSPAIQRSPATTEAMALMMRWAFEAGYRRYEWKCNALNLPSRRAAQRLGFSYEGTFRQAMVLKGHNRDTAWFAAVDGDWPALRAAHDAWLAPGNFDAAGRQKHALSALTAPILAARDPALGP
ncbi:RimJ/RimL family protein N-acetyltransferase [Pseudoroseicyclus aestuarii]|uniref:RimJ/RimL family protein N-acetyltransferase n=1 Tax=Pseudoroseicyclus aestuarii TaxID=1795041 RepID=A0A318SR36_9RHOB|nr:RimJ/RimL family protein N-acetyltransferase [Pseudoroseicyclus aestuarii]